MDLNNLAQALAMVIGAIGFGWWLRGRPEPEQCVTIMIDGEPIEVTADVIGRAGVLMFLGSCGVTAFNDDGSPTPNRLLMLRTARDLGHKGPPGFSWDQAFEALEGDNLFPQVVRMNTPYRPHRRSPSVVPQEAPKPPEDAL